MNKFFNILTLFFSIFILFSCEPGRAENGDLLFGVNGSSGSGGGGTTVSKKLKSVTVDDGTDVITYSYTYNSDGKLTKLKSSDNSGNYELFYDANKSIDKITVTQSDGSLITTTNFSITYQNGEI